MIYFDNNATTPILSDVREVMADAMERFWGNPSSIHRIGCDAIAELEKARDRLSQILGVHPLEIYFTSGGTEADNLAILGFMEKKEHSGDIIISAVEHPAVKQAAEYLIPKGVNIHRLSVCNNGEVDIDHLDNLLSNKNMQLVSIMAANNEIGTIQPLNMIGELCKKYGVMFHTDAVQAFCKTPLNFKRDNIGMASISAHKIYGPKGCGALFLQKGFDIAPRTFGGSQERNLRTGTQNLPAILGFVKAAELAIARMDVERNMLFDLSEYFYSQICSNIDNVIRNGDSVKRLAGTLNVSFLQTTSEMLVAALDLRGVSVSGGAACSSGASTPSHVLTAIGCRCQDALSAVRFSLGMHSNRDEVDKVVKILKEVVEHLRTTNE